MTVVVNELKMDILMTLLEQTGIEVIKQNYVKLQGIRLSFKNFQQCQSILFLLHPEITPVIAEAC